MQRVLSSHSRMDQVVTSVFDFSVDRVCPANVECYFGSLASRRASTSPCSESTLKENALW